MSSLKNVMIVEDDDAIREALCMVVESEGYTCISARNGKEALGILNQPDFPEPCVIFLDLMMPEMNGWEFLAAKRKLDVIISIPVVVMSAIANEAVIPSGVTKILRKPMEINNLIQNFRDLCDVESRKAILDSGSIWTKKQAA